MSVIIKKIRIENFRSIHILEIETSPFTVLVGKNDCGKSNILRALNLFFNGETNHNTGFNFEDDYNFFAPILKRKAKEIVVRIEAEIPKSYRRTNGDFIVWEKRWRRDGLDSGPADYHGYRMRKNNRGKMVKDKVSISEKSNLHALLRKIEFEYVPAIKDNLYFDDLRGRIYKIISEAAAQTFRTSSGAFEKSIGEHLKSLTQSIDESLGSTTRLALPRDLSHIFEKLDFLSGDQSVSLENRGDGIKARHIPLILKFMALKKMEIQGKGSMPTSFLWGYEEPENNLEFSSALALSDELVEHVNNEVAQILVTTHSPVFYDLAGKNSDIFLQHISRSSDTEGTKASRNNSDLDDSLGTLAMMAPRISEIVTEVRKREQAKTQAEILLKEKRSKIFVEGESDKIILTKAMEIFYPELKAEIDFLTKRNGAGHTYVLDMLAAWRTQHKHHPHHPKAAGVVDADAKKQKSKFNEVSDNINSAKCFTYPTPEHLFNGLQKKFKINIDLEALYTKEAWEWAKSKNYLKRRDPKDVYPNDLLTKILNREADLGDDLEDDWRIYVENQFDYKRKITAANYLASLNDNKCRSELAAFKPALTEILEYLELIPNIDTLKQ